MNVTSRATPGTDERVPRHTHRRANARIHAQTVENLLRYVGAPAEVIEGRIVELRREWDIERTLEANAATVALVGAALGATVDRRFFALPAVVATFLLQHAVQGWCPPLPVFRRFGIRTSAEIHSEIVALRMLRGDFGVRSSDAEAALVRAKL